MCRSEDSYGQPSETQPTTPVMPNTTFHVYSIHMAMSNLIRKGLPKETSIDYNAAYNHYLCMQKLIKALENSQVFFH